MSEVFGALIYPVGVAILMLPFVLVMILASVLANLYSGICKPVTEPLYRVIESVSERVPNPLDRIPSFPRIKRLFGSTKNILFVLFVFVFLVVYYLTSGSSDIALINISQLFPGSAFGTLISFIIAQGELDAAAFFVDPANYLRTIVFAGITGLFLHMGCTTKEEGAKIPFLVKLMYIVLITLFSSVVLEKIPPDVFTITLPAYSSKLDPVSLAIDCSSAEMLLTTLQRWGGILLEKLLTLIPIIVAGYFLCQSISGFAAALLGGIAAIAALSIACPQVFLNPASFGTAILLLLAVSLAEAVALLFGEFVDKIVERLFEKIEKIFEYYNIITLLISYFSYPMLVLPVCTLINNSSNISRLLGMACLLVFALAAFVGYKINQWVWKREESVDGKKYVLLMVINIPILIVYGVMFKG